MTTYINSKAYVDYYADPVTQTAAGDFGTATYLFRSDGTVVNGRIKVTEANLKFDCWVAVGDLLELTDEQLKPDFPPLKLKEFYEEACWAADTVNRLPGVGSMNVEYLLLLGWIESGLTNSDAQGRQGQDADLAGPVGPFRFSAETWSFLLRDPDLAEVTQGYDDNDRYKPNVQPIFAAGYTTHMQNQLRNQIGMIDPPAWLLRLGHRIGPDNLVRFAQIDDGAAVSSQIGGSVAVDAATVQAFPHLFPSGNATTRAEVHAAISREFQDARANVVARLGNVLDELKLSINVIGDGVFRQGILGFLDFIGKYEAAGNYNAYFGHTDNVSNPALTNKTIDDVLAYQDQLGKNVNACGKYQFIRPTLDRIYGPAGFGLDTPFNEDVQDELARYLLLNDCKGDHFLRSDRTHADFLDFALNVAKTWAALPVLLEMQGSARRVQRGQSYYAGVNSNKAQVSADLYEAALRKLMDEEQAYSG